MKRRWMKRRQRRKDRGRLPDNEALLNEFRGPGLCEFCRMVCREREAAHIFSRGMGGWSRMDVRLNLVALGGPFDCGCHVRHHQNLIPSVLNLLDIVAEREQIPVAEVRDYLNMLKWNRT